MRRMLTVVSATLFGVSAWGGVIITNITGNLNGISSISGVAAGAVGFTMDAGTNYNLTGVSFALFNGENSALPGSGLNIGLFGDGGNKPVGSALTTFSLSGNIVVGDGVYSVTPNSPFQLNASTTYWLIWNDPSASSLNLRGTLNSNPSGPAATDAGESGGSMTSATQVGSFSPSSGQTILRYEVDGDPVTTSATPEPATFCLVGGALALAGMLRRRR